MEKGINMEFPHGRIRHLSEPNMKSKRVTICELHGEEMATTKVRIQYGYPAFDGTWEVAAELFPNANSYSLGGCVMDVDNPKFEYLPVCGECRRAEEKWRAEHAEDDMLL
jgi:hypothetical protein